METTVEITSGIMTVKVDGEINTLTAPELAKQVADLTGVRVLIFDLDLVPYVSSAGLRLFLACQRSMDASGGKMRLVRCNEFMAEIFEGVGYDNIMDIEIKRGEQDADTVSR